MRFEKNLHFADKVPQFLNALRSRFEALLFPDKQRLPFFKTHKVKCPSNRIQGSPNKRNPAPGTGSSRAAHLPLRIPTAFAYRGNATTANPPDMKRSNTA